jgi:hypothetical protein
MSRAYQKPSGKGRTAPFAARMDTAHAAPKEKTP